MKQSTNYFALQRYKALWDAYCDAMSSPDVHSHSEALKKAISSPTSRYWISASEATRQISLILAGQEPKYAKGGKKWKMIWKVYDEFLRLKELRQFKGCSTYFITSFAVLHPADSFYISFDRARRIINKIKRGYYNIYDDDED